ncbi:MAG TPA: VIT and VWA domain-containing protein [Acidobacteriaceae bacterium]
MNFLRTCLLFLTFASTLTVNAATGVLIPRDKQAPDPSILTLEEMSVEITIDNGDARVFITQIFLNHTNRIEEGTYNFALPSGSTVSDFAVWDGAVRIPAVILERKRAQEVYEQARMQSIDPGLLQMGERDNADPARTALFSAKIVPIPAYGTKRLELEYHQRIDATAFRQAFILPLKPDAVGEQRVHKFHVNLRLHSAHPFTGLKLNAAYPLKIGQQDAHSLTASFGAIDTLLTDDLTATWSLDPSAADALEVIAHRDPRAAQSSPDQARPMAATGPEPGFFEATALIGEGANKPTSDDVAPPRTIVVLFDNSLSMQWEKLERSYGAAETLLRKLRPSDRFNVILFNQDTASFSPQPVPADAAHIQQALDFIRASKLRGGTDIGKVLTTGLAQSTEPDTSLVLLTDGGSDRGATIITGKIAANYTRARKAVSHPPHTDIFAVGDDANLGLLRLLAKNDGILEQVRSTEPVEFHLAAFLSKITHNPVTGLALDIKPASAPKFVYPLDDAVFTGSIASWIGQYTQPAKLDLDLHGIRNNATFDIKATAAFPATELNHPQLPRLWAQARVDALLDQINRDGETAAAIDEIIRLARRYKLVTPYTSFLAVPRSLLRPRVIRPGDPVLRVRTDPAIESVIAIFSFGLTKPLRHLSTEDRPDAGDTGGRLWETRFLAPDDMKDGTYSVRLILRDTSGHTYREEKTFVIASTPPTVKILLPNKRLHRGESIQLRATASESTRTLTARLPGIAPINMRWNSAAAANAGTLTIPADMPIGAYTLSVTAEDIAHNLGSEEVQIDVIP